MVAGILMGSPARMHSRSSAITSMLMEGGTVKTETLEKTSVTETNKQRVILYVRVKHTLDVFNQNLASAGARVRFTNVVYSNNPEAMAFQLTETRHSELSGGVQGVVHLHPVRFPFILDLNDVPLNGTSTVPLWWLPGQSDTVLCLISNHRSSRHAGRSWGAAGC